jgi:hypothetical protein
MIKYNDQILQKVVSDFPLTNLLFINYKTIAYPSVFTFEDKWQSQNYSPRKVWGIFYHTPLLS